jgi:NTP pyrophosphatase (non-canonical NTP hydrolase)
MGATACTERGSRILDSQGTRGVCGTRRADAWELADCVIALWAHAIVCDLDLADAIERKLIQNEKRKWVVQPNGTVRWDRRFPVEL